MTIVQAIEQVLRSHEGPMSAREIYRAIQRDELYSFRAQDPVHVVQTQLRRHSDVDSDQSQGGKEPRFLRIDRDKFVLR
jgi:restriction system protein